MGQAVVALGYLCSIFTLLARTGQCCFRNAQLASGRRALVRFICGDLEGRLSAAHRRTRPSPAVPPALPVLQSAEIPQSEPQWGKVEVEARSVTAAICVARDVESWRL